MTRRRTRSVNGGRSHAERGNEGTSHAERGNEIRAGNGGKIRADNENEGKPHIELAKEGRATPKRRSKRKRKAPSLWEFVFRRPLPLEQETSLFILVNAGDVFMTYMLLRSDEFYESNPLARYILNHWGMEGMIYYKFALVAVVCVIAQIIAPRRFEVARKLLNFATLVVGGVVIYSFTLFLRNLSAFF